MSDDGYYAESPYDEFEEMLWDADPAPDLADDLAQHAAYSPVWQDDPIGELSQYHSDWDYYSDDYFDDDPAILKKNPMDGVPRRSAAGEHTRARRGQKRKFAEVSNTSDQLENTLLKGTIRGTVWASDVASNIKIFRDGQDDKVALLTDWRERFQINTRKRSLPTQKTIDRDEAWANDLGLADMGLAHACERQSTQRDVSPGVDAAEDEGREEESDFSASDVLKDNESSFVEDEIPEKEDDRSASRPSVSTTKSATVNITSNGNPTDDDNVVTSQITTSPTRKRRRLTVDLILPEEPPTSEKKHKSPDGYANIPTAGSTTRTDKHVGTRKASKQASSNSKTQPSTNSTTQKKRKLSVSSESLPATHASTESSRAKRRASSKLTGSHNTGTEIGIPSANTRSAKARKS